MHRAGRSAFRPLALGLALTFPVAVSGLWGLLAAEALALVTLAVVDRIRLDRRAAQVRPAWRSTTTGR